MVRTDASKHEAAINRAIRAKRPLVIIGWSRPSAIGPFKSVCQKIHGIPNTMPHMEAVNKALEENREFFVYSDFDRRYLTAEELRGMLRAEEN